MGVRLGGTDVEQFLNHRFAEVYNDKLYSPSGESSLSEERGNPGC
jgi:hypothetical protein